AAEARLDHAARAYLAGGSADEITLRWNREAFDTLALVPRVLRGVGELDTRCELLGETLEHPVLLAPTGYNLLFHPEGERATARGAADAGAVLVLSSVATLGIEETAAAAPARLWFQLYFQRDRDFTRRLLARAEAAGCRALVLTVDTPVLGARDRERRAGFRLPRGVRAENLVGASKDLAHGHSWSEDGIYSPLSDPTLTWETVAWLREQTRLPLVLKGVLAPDDARRAVEAGAAGIIVSNHGGRNLDTAVAAIAALPAVAVAVAGRVPVLFDGGVRRGTDIVKSPAPGARAVMIGRPYLWGLAVDGAAGVERVVKMLVTELKSAMALCGTPKLADIGRELVRGSGTRGPLDPGAAGS
ncbi:MAG: alpha-hydroxy-acid oxidizing protein, partial [Candidatus Eisenbacteria bacterium]|nr:alpha-hydroxy-acid oxidizing protein [Candidatus Eisenbacteria bacterium]